MWKGLAASSIQEKHLRYSLWVVIAGFVALAVVLGLSIDRYPMASDAAAVATAAGTVIGTLVGAFVGMQVGASGSEGANRAARAFAAYVPPEKAREILSFLESKA